MAIYKICTNCKAKYDASLKRCDKCEGSDRARYKRYSKVRTDKELQGMYNSKRWKEVREIIKNKQFGLCLMSLLDGEIAYIDLIHHINPAKDEVDEFYNIENLIGVCESKHREIHKAYEAGGKTKEDMIEYLNKLKAMTFNEIVEMSKLY